MRVKPGFRIFLLLEMGWRLLNQDLQSGPYTSPHQVTTHLGKVLCVKDDVAVHACSAIFCSHIVHESEHLELLMEILTFAQRKMTSE
jgi:hypothetical protein